MTDVVHGRHAKPNAIGGNPTVCADHAWPGTGQLGGGDVLMESARAFPDRQFTVLCGHTHSPGEARLLPNLLATTGRARYGFPEVQQGWDVL